MALVAVLVLVWLVVANLAQMYIHMYESFLTDCDPISQTVGNVSLWLVFGGTYRGMLGVFDPSGG